MDENRRINRRKFFGEGLRELLRGVQKAMEPLAEAAKQLSDLETQTSSSHSYSHYTPPEPYVPDRPMLRPPGALAEEQFLNACSRCGECVRVCPAQCIHIDPSGMQGKGAPFIDVQTMPCVLCDGLLCMSHCPSGALVPTPREQIRMGLAEWREEICLRRQGENCTVCVDRCPMGTAALRLDEEENRIVVDPTGCTGCGVCEHDCPTYPKSIVVNPMPSDVAKRADDPGGAPAPEAGEGVDAGAGSADASLSPVPGSPPEGTVPH